MRLTRIWGVAAAALAAVATVPTAAAAGQEGMAPGPGPVTPLATFAADGCAGACGSGSTVGPDGALYVTDGAGGRVLRVDPDSGAVSVDAEGLPPAVPGVGLGGAIDVAFHHGTAYVLVTLVGPFFGQPDVVNGLYRIDADGSVHVVADLGAWSREHPPATDFAVDSGLQYALEPYRGGFLVTDGHHNRILAVEVDGAISEVLTLGNVVPTGVEVSGGRVYVAEAGAVPHLPADGRITAADLRRGTVAPVASGASLLVDVDRHRGTLYALSQGDWTLPPIPENAGAPADPGTGRLVVADRDGALRTVASGIDRPTSMEIIDGSAYIVTMTGTVVTVDLHRR